MHGERHLEIMYKILNCDFLARRHYLNDVSYFYPMFEVWSVDGCKRTSLTLSFMMHKWGATEGILWIESLVGSGNVL